MLSALLCSFFYGDLERRVYKFTEDVDCVRASLFVVHRGSELLLTMMLGHRHSCGSLMTGCSSQRICGRQSGSMIWCRKVRGLSRCCDFMLRRRTTGHPEYGCFISKDKSLLNFDHPALPTIVDPRSKGAQDVRAQAGGSLMSSSVFPWCGYSINMKDLSVTVDYTRYHQTC